MSSFVSIGRPPRRIRSVPACLHPLWAAGADVNRCHQLSSSAGGAAERRKGYHRLSTVIFCGSRLGFPLPREREGPIAQAMGGCGDRPSRVTPRPASGRARLRRANPAQPSPPGRGFVASRTVIKCHHLSSGFDLSSDRKPARRSRSRPVIRGLMLGRNKPVDPAVFCRASSVRRRAGCRQWSPVLCPRPLFGPRPHTTPAEAQRSAGDHACERHRLPSGAAAGLRHGRGERGPVCRYRKKIKKDKMGLPQVVPLRAPLPSPYKDIFMLAGRAPLCYRQRRIRNRPG